MTPDDAVFMLRLLNEPSWLQYIGDRGVRTLDDAHAYILNGPVDMYARLGFGFYVVELKEGGTPIGICGLAKRDHLDAVDIGYALLPEHWAQGYAYEAAAAVLEYGLNVLGLKRIIAITSPDNDRSGRLLEKLGFRYEQLTPTPNAKTSVKVYAIGEGPAAATEETAAPDA
jgi:RimJ/RimL family protein N-acetyltransferase